MCYNMDSLAFPRRRQQAPAPRGNMCSNNMCSNLHAIHMIYYCVRASIQRKAKTDVCQKCAWNTPWFTQHTVIHGTHRDSRNTPWFTSDALCSACANSFHVIRIIMCGNMCRNMHIIPFIYNTAHITPHSHIHEHTHTLSLSLSRVCVSVVWCVRCYI